MNKVLVGITSFIVIIIVGFFGIPYLLGTRRAETKSTFTDEQIKIIADKLDIGYEELSVEKLEYTHYKSRGENVIQFRVFGKLSGLDSVDKAYKLDKTISGNSEIRYYSHKNNANISCDITIRNNTAPYEVYFRINEADQELDAMMKQKK